jgi:hypothetical protein
LFAVGGVAFIWALAMLDRPATARSGRLKSSGFRARGRLATRYGSGR